MTCHVITMPDGSTAIVCTRGTKPANADDQGHVWDSTKQRCSRCDLRRKADTSGPKPVAVYSTDGGETWSRSKPMCRAKEGGQ